MADEFIELFMWGYQQPFRHGVQFGVEHAIEEIGSPADVTVMLVGLLKSNGEGHPICIEPEDGPVTPRDFDGLAARAAELFQSNPESRIRNSVPFVHEQRQQWVLDGAYCTAIAEILERKLNRRFFVALPSLINQHFVYTGIGLPPDLIESTPALATKTGPDGRFRVTASLLQGAVDELMRLSSRALHEPDAGSSLGLGMDAADVARAAGRSFTYSTAVLAGNQFGSGLFDAMNSVSTTRLEQRVGIGRLVLAGSQSPSAITTVTLKDAVPLRETRTLRKLLEVSSADGEALMTDGRVAYGLGQIRSDYDASSESAFEILVAGHGSWELRHEHTALMTVQNGTPRLPEPRLKRDRFEDIAQRVFAGSGGCDAAAIWDLAMAAADAEHGTMLVVSATAEDEATRLGGQALRVEPSRLNADVVRQLTGIDGAVLVNPDGLVHAIGVILDGNATSDGDRSRGARYNSAVRYRASSTAATLIVLVSEDGMLNVLPDLRPRASRADLGSRMQRLREAALIEPVHAERFYDALNQVKRASFYLSAAQCDEVNTLTGDHWARRRAAGAQIWPNEPDLVPHPDMSDEYLVE